MPTPQDSDRLWYPLDASVPLENGYLTPRSEDQGATLQELSSIPCLVLLGSPGMGKSYEARAAYEAGRSRGKAIDLFDAPRSRDPGNALISLLNGDTAAPWRNRQGAWELLVDSIDELEGGAAAFVQSLKAFLEQLLSRGGDLATFRLRLFCRTIDWASTLDDALAAVWPDAEREKRQLAPFREADVGAAAQADLNTPSEVQAFMDRLSGAHLQALAARPVSYRMLVNLFARHNELPLRQADIFQQGLRALLIDATRRRSSDATEGAPVGGGSVRLALSPERLTMLAGRVAFAMAMSGVGTVTIGEPRPGLLSLQSLAMGTEPSPPYSFRVRTADLLDVVRSPLFTPVGADTFVWSHKSFLEYLAARYLVDHEIEAGQTLDLLSVKDPDNRAEGVVPQFREIAAWTATLSPAIFNALIEREPDILLQSDVASVEDRTRARLVDALLTRLDSGELAPGFWQLRPYFSRLNHPGLADQLRGVIFDPDRNYLTRRGALDIGKEARVRTFVPDLAQLVRDPQTHISLRRAAAGVIEELGTDAEKAVLVDILTDEDAAQLDDEIRGTALNATWPERLSVPQLLASLTRPQQPNFIGTYSMFLYRFQPGTLSNDDAQAVFAWLEATVQRAADGDDRASSDRGVRSRLLWAAVARIDDVAVRRAFAHLVLHAFDHQATFLFEKEDSKPERLATSESRLAVVLEVLRQAKDPVVAGRYLVHFAGPLFDVSDLEIYLTEITRLQPGALKVAFAELLISLTRDRDLDELGTVWALAERDNELGAAWRSNYWIAIDSPVVEWLRDAETRKATTSSRQDERAEARQRADEVLQTLLTESETDPSVWWRINLQLFVSDQGDFKPELEFESELTASPGWLRLGELDQARVIDGAERYLRHYRLETLRWLGTNTQHRPAAAGYRAARLLFDRRQATFQALDAEIWTAWGGSVVSFFDNDAEAAANVQPQILKRAYELAAPAIHTALARMACGPKSRGLSSRTLELLNAVYDDALGDLLSRLRGHRLRGESTEALIIGFLVRQNYGPIISETIAVLASKADRSSHSAQEADLTDALAGAAAELLANGQEEPWRLVTDLGRTDPTAAQKIWETAVSNHHFGRYPNVSRIDDELIARAYLDLEALFPLSAEEDETGARFLTTVDFVERLRAGLINTLVTRGTPGSIAALERLATTAVRGEDIRFRLPEARQKYRAKTGNRDPIAVLDEIAVLGRSYPEQSEIEATVEQRDEDVPIQQVPSDDTGPSSPNTLPVASGGGSASRHLKIVTVATEWRSGHGGVSTLNRELCIALAALGHTVYCAVTSASAEEQLSAADAGVQLVACSPIVGLNGAEPLLTLKPEDFGSATPDVVIGHDQITGPHGLFLANKFERPYVHVLHTIPEEIEPQKGRTRAARGGVFSGHNKREAQNELCKGASLVVGIGPRIFAQIPTGRSAPSHELIPGLNTELLSLSVTRARQASCLLTGRMEDADLKGLRTAAQAINNLRSSRTLALDASVPVLVVRGLDTIYGEDELREAGLDQQERGGWLRPRPYSETAADIYEDIQASTLVLMPSLSEGFGLTGYEAIAAGIPVLMSEDSGLADLMKYAERNLLIDAGFAAACIVPSGANEQVTRDRWADQIRALHADLDAAFNRAASVRTRMESCFTWSNAARELVAKLETLDSAH